MPIHPEPSGDRHRSQLDVMIIEDQRDVREGLAVLINGTPGFHCTRSYRTMEEALRTLGDARQDRPHVILTDIGLPGMSGIDGIAALRKYASHAGPTAEGSLSHSVQSLSIYDKLTMVYMSPADWIDTRAFHKNSLSFRARILSAYRPCVN